MGMTGMVSPGAGAGPGARPELRASHEDRDRAVELLRVAAGDGRLTAAALDERGDGAVDPRRVAAGDAGLTAAELDERLEAALTARTRGELAELTADLPAVPGQ